MEKVFHSVEVPDFLQPVFFRNGLTIRNPISDNPPYDRSYPWMRTRCFS
jgi:hypothetical protein